MSQQPLATTQLSHDATFGEFRLDITNECLWRGTRAISLRPKAFAVLKLLIEHSGQLVNKQHVLDTVWPNTFVGDTVLKDNIRQLRKALDDDSDKPRFIETSHRRGYRFIGKLTQPAAKQAPIETVSETASATVATLRLMTSNNMLGRDADLLQLQSWLNLALDGSRQTVFVTGEPGIGKTTLVERFIEHVSELPGALVVRGQCLEHYGSGEAYLPVLDGLTRLCRSQQGSRAVEVLRQHAPAWIAQMPALLPASERAAFVEPRTASRERMLREMAESIEALGSDHPVVVLVLEDLHWSDYSTLDLVTYLARRRDPARLLVIGTYRPVDVILSEHPLKGVKRELQAHGFCHELPLENLSEETVSEYLAARFPQHDLPKRLARAIYSRTEGNPLFMQNLVDYWVERKVIAEEHSTWTLKVELREAERGLPSSLRELIEKQIERLTPDERMVLEGASVAGVECSSAAIAAGLDKPTDWVESQCELLARRHNFLSAAWLVQLPDGTMTPRHRFNHMLYLEVPYRLIPPMRRAQIHQRIAARGVEIYGERDTEIAAELAMHFEQSRDWPSAYKYLLRAAENATARSAHHEATDLLTRGLEILEYLPDSPERARQEMKLRMLLGVSLMVIKGFASAEVEEVYARGRQLFWQLGPSPELFHMLLALNLYYQFGGEMNSSLEISGQLLELAGGLKDGTLIMEAHRSLGAALMIMGRCEEALVHLDAAVELYSTYGKHSQAIFVGRDCKVTCDSFAARALLSLGRQEEALQRMARSLDFGHELGRPQTLVLAAYSAAHLHHLLGDRALSSEYAKQALDLAEEYGLEFWRPYGIIQLGWADAESGNQQRGIEQMQRGLAVYEATGAKLWTPYLLGLLADQLGKASRVEEGLTTIAKAFACAEKSGEAYSVPELHRIKAELLSKAEPVLV